MNSVRRRPSEPSLRSDLVFLSTEDRILNPMESGVFTFGKQCSSDKIETIESTVRKLADEAAANIDLNAIENSVRGFAEGSRVLMNALDEVAKLHPFIAGTVSALGI